MAIRSVVTLSLLGPCLFGCVAGASESVTCDVSTENARLELSAQGDIDCVLEIRKTDLINLDDFSGVKSARGLRVVRNAHLQDAGGIEGISIDNLSIQIEANPELTSLSFIGAGRPGSLAISCLHALTSLELPASTGSGALIVEGTPNLVNMNLGSITEVDRILLHGTGLSSLQGLAQIQSVESVQITENHNLDAAEALSFVANFSLEGDEALICGNEDDEPCDLEVAESVECEGFE